MMFLGKSYLFICFYFYFFLTKYSEGGRHFKSNVQDGRRLSFALQNTSTLQFTIDEKNCWDIILKWDNLGELNNLHLSPIPSIQSWSVSCFQQITRTAVQRCMGGGGGGLGEGKIYFPPFKLARRQTGPLGQSVPTNFVADCRKIARERKRKKIYNAIITSFPGLIEHSSRPIRVWKIALLL